MRPIKVLLADDHPLFRSGLKQLLDMQEGMEVVGEAANGSEAWSEAKRLAPDLVIMDVNMPGSGGIEATRRIKRELPAAKIPRPQVRLSLIHI